MRRTLEEALRAPSDIRFDVRDGIATITIERPEDGNLLSPSSLAHLAHAAERLAGDERTNCLVVTGAGSEHFSAGIFNIETRAAYSKEDVLKIVQLANDAFDKLEALPQLVIGALNGAVRAGGGELALACDLRIAANHATLAFHETSYACFPGAGAAVRLPATVGAGRALELIATGREIDVAEMLRIGFATVAVPGNELLDHVDAMAKRVGARGPLGIRGAKQVIRERARHGADAAHELSRRLRAELEYSHDVDEAVAAHRERRAAVYLGR